MIVENLAVDYNNLMRVILMHIFSDIKERYGDLYYLPQNNINALKYVLKLPLDTEELKILVE